MKTGPPPRGSRLSEITPLRSQLSPTKQVTATRTENTDSHDVRAVQHCFTFLGCGAAAPPAFSSASSSPPPVLAVSRGGCGQGERAPPPQAVVKPHVLTHLIEGFVIQEGAEPFPVSTRDRQCETSSFCRRRSRVRLLGRRRTTLQHPTTAVDPAEGNLKRLIAACPGAAAPVTAAERLYLRECDRLFGFCFFSAPAPIFRLQSACSPVRTQ